MMQCPFTAVSTCLLTTQVLFLALASLSFLLGALSVISPSRSIGFYQWIMERFNWKVTPKDMEKELRNTRLLGFVLIVLGLALVASVFFKFCS